MFNTKKSLTLRSLKMFESGPINLRDTLGMFMNWLFPTVFLS